MKWIIPSIEEEKGEFARVAKLLGVELSEVRALFDAGSLESLDLESWKSLENTDSWGTTTMDQVRTLSALYGRDCDAVTSGLIAEHNMPAPIVLCLADGRRHLVSGNTRLMVCRALGIMPLIYKINSSFMEKQTP